MIQESQTEGEDFYEEPTTTLPKTITEEAYPSSVTGYYDIYGDEYYYPEIPLTDETLDTEDYIVSGGDWLDNQ
ncbi:hypothetical protein chiPu_0023242, partial [Chiloscyllium punctatum]|nr:hypothetical protein [Chiloscyllium punctatum]